MASSKLGEGSIDLGAPIIDANDVEFESWLREQGVEQWFPSNATLQLEKRKPISGWVMAPRSSALTRQLAGGVELRTNVRVAVVWPDREGVLLRDAAGEALGHFDAVVIAAPAPQAATLLDAIQRFRHRAEKTAVSAIWTMALSLPERPAVLADVDWLEGEDEVIARVVRDSSKPQRSGENWIIQATEAWSQQVLDLEPDDVGREMLDAVSRAIGETLIPENVRVHRWRYARATPEQGHENALWDEQSGIGACGDWLCGGNVEGAWRSANELVARILGSRLKVA
ncbi:MAG: hypothetical protein GYB21_16860 [Oceanospirillales bacterium]|nr:hypothetical protein [Oceanospirillales bacterium]